MIKQTTVKQGKVRGRYAADPRVIAYLGVPYAAPPIGDLRWHEPVEHPTWEGVRDCLEFSAIPMQSAPSPGGTNVYDNEWQVDPTIPMSEDCLTCNIWTPAKTTDEKLPVFFWIHGGALQWGNSAEMEFDGERIARRGIVVVTINYRLNVFGFFAGKDSKGNKIARNIGNLDQQFALKWVYENIAAFGGDPENITIGGQSAGGGSAMSQLNCAANKPMIKKAIILSGMFRNPYMEMFSTTLETMEQQSEEFLHFLGVETLEEARELPAESIRAKNDQFGKFWLTVVDGEFQTDNYDRNVQNKVFLDVPMIHGWTNNEFFNSILADSVDEIEEKAKEIFGDMADEWLSLVDTTKGLEQAKKDSEVTAVEVSNRLLPIMCKEAGYASPHYIYEFGPLIPGYDNPGAFHSSDLWFFFETLAKCWRPFTGQHYDLAKQMCNYWCNFIKTGDPNNNGEAATVAKKVAKDPYAPRNSSNFYFDESELPEWKAYTPEDPEIMYFHEAAKLKCTPASPMMDFCVRYHKKLAEEK